MRIVEPLKAQRLYHSLVHMSTSTTYPDFPNNVSTHPLVVIDYALVQSGDEQELETLWKAATELGFW